ncbi:MAG: T9SS type A sorting domain-containing protein [Bacteroidia bacterium]
MKKIYSLILFAFAGLTAFAQPGGSIPNGNFESWTVLNGDIPSGFGNVSNGESFFRCNSPMNCVKVMDSYHGTYALKLTTQMTSTDTCFGYAVTSPNPNGGGPCQWQGGLPINATPTGARGYYKSNIAVGDTGGVLFAFKKNGVCVGLWLQQLYGVHNTYTPFSMTFAPTMTVTPDTFIFAAISSDAFNQIALNGSMLQLDSISFTGIAQPASWNGDFENWTTQSFQKPDFWYLSGGGNGSTAGVSQTSDKKAGNYAAELQTYLGDRCSGGNNCHPAAQGAQISTGWYPNHCGGGCVQQGGHPFTNQIDTLCFYYKYAPQGNDTAECNINFKKAGSQVTMTGAQMHGTVSTYSYMEVPFNTMNPVDTVIVSFNSTNWRDTLLSYIGTDLKIDEVHFKSQPYNTGVKAYDASVGIKVFPNPSNDGNFVVSNIGYYDLVRVMNLYGQEVNAEIKKVNGTAQIHIATPGAYTVFVNSRGNTTTLKVIVSKE